MIRREDIIRAGTNVNDFMYENPELPPEIVAAIQTLKDGCLELIRIPVWIRKHYDTTRYYDSEGDGEDGVWLRDEPERGM